MPLEARLAELGLVLPKPAAAAANYVPAVEHNGLLHIAGQLPFEVDGSLVHGRLGAEISVEEGFAAARRCALNIVAQVAGAGALDRLERIVKLGVFVASAPGFHDQPKVANGASDLLVALFGEAGRHARSAVGVAELPFNVPVEVDAIIALRA